MVRDAEAAGFNPLTALRNGGAAGFSVTSQPVLSSTHAAIGEAIGGIGNFIANFDPFEDKMREVQYRTMEAQIANINADTAFKSRSMMFDPPAVSGRRAVAAGPSLAQSAHTPVASWFEPPKGVDALPVWVPGVDRDGKKMWIPNPDGPDAEQLAGAYLMRSISGYEALAGTAVDLALDPASQVRIKRLPTIERNAYDLPGGKQRKSWWDYIPSISYR